MSTIIKCKMCGGDLALVEGSSIATCEFCGTQQTVPNQDSEKKLILFERADRLRRNCEFDKAEGLYESIVSEYRQEAEAYWGLVLCKYGIEYVDDPATGKKVPTCHRSSFDPVMDDPNFDMAMEYADMAAQRLYREEAKQIERIRKGILEVSSAEEPYDIFICYKEKNENKERTVDSLLAENVYNALTEKGYRVFFARVTLEDKLGVAYEPYIFAALNSAKVMLAIGTCYEYYNAVWVKNEWSRYLKIVAQDKSKYLIPCYKDIDPYDIPKEFQHLQAQDLGKVGGMQDLIRGIEKIIPRKESNTIVVQQALSTNAMALLKRGNMALEDRDWAGADKFFEEVLNQNAECAEAYIGKALAQAHCVSLESFVNGRLAHTKEVDRPDVLHIEEDKMYVFQSSMRYKVPGYLESYHIRDEYKYDLSYNLEVTDRKKQKQEELNFWNSNRNLIRAEKFASGATAQQLTAAKKKLIAALDKRIADAEQDVGPAKERREKAYRGFLSMVDQEMEKKHQEAAVQREHDYGRFLQIAKESNDIAKLGTAKEGFAKMLEYKDAPDLANLCQERIETLKAEQKQEQEARRKEKLRQEQEAREKKAAEDHARKQEKLKQDQEEKTLKLQELRVDEKKIKKYLNICRLFALVFVEILVAGALEDKGIISNETCGMIGAICMLIHIAIAIAAAIYWNKIWVKYRKLCKMNFFQKIWGNKVMILKKHLDAAIAETEKELETIREQIDP